MAHPQRMREAVVLVHGIWMTGLDLLPLRRRLEEAGFEARVFRYPSLRWTPARSARLLHDALAEVEGDVLHLVGHSLGGLVILHLFERFPPRRPGRVVLLSSPVNGSAVARCLAARSITRPLLGRSTEAGLLGGVPRWWGTRDLGTIAGDHSIGVGRVIGALERPNDGTVAVAETRLQNAVDAITLPSSHMGLVFSRPVADHVACFLRTGRFS